MVENMDMTLVFAALATAFVAVASAAVFLLRSKKKSEQELQRTQLLLQEEQQKRFSAESELKLLKERLAELSASAASLQEERNRLTKEATLAQAKAQAMQEANAKLTEHYEQQSKKLELRLNEIMQKNLDKKIEKFDENSTKALQNILKPFKENIENFKKKVEESQEKSIQRFAALSKEIENIAKASMNISAEAQNLAEALKGKKQSTGAWGEMILDTVLEYSGLLNGIHYEKQNSYRDESGNMKRPDVVIKLPQGRSIVIDSKVSLVDYDEFVRAQSDEERTIAAKKLAQDFKNHIDTLASKDYTHYDLGTLQYVFMFVPIEGAFATALQYDGTLYEYALKKHIAIVTPSTLTVSLRTIYLYWQSEKSSEYALKLFEEAGKLYDKVTVFATTFEKIGAQLQTVQKSYDQAYNQLAKGGGNVLKRVANLKTLGAKTTKNLKTTKIEYDDFESEDVSIELLEEKKDEDGNRV